MLMGYAAILKREDGVQLHSFLCTLSLYLFDQNTIGMRYTANHTIEIGFGYRIEQEKDPGDCGSFVDREDEAIAHSVLRHLARYQ